jgi:hypothetical protein
LLEIHSFAWATRIEAHADAYSPRYGSLVHSESL